MSKSEILEKYGAESEEYRNYCEVQMIIKMKKSQRDEYFEGIRNKRGEEVMKRLYAECYQEFIKTRLKNN